MKIFIHLVNPPGDRSETITFCGAVDGLETGELHEADCPDCLKAYIAELESEHEALRDRETHYRDAYDQANVHLLEAAMFRVESIKKVQETVLETIDLEKKRLLDFADTLRAGDNRDAARRIGEAVSRIVDLRSLVLEKLTETRKGLKMRDDG